MSVRVNKCLGYGFSNVITENGVMDDLRFSKMGWFGGVDKTDYMTRDGFIDYLEAQIYNDESSTLNLQITLKQLKQDNLFYVPDHIIYDFELGRNDTIVFIPPSNQRSWVHVDDPIDYYHETVVNKQKPNVVHMDRPLFPWISYSNIANGNPIRLTNESTETLRMLRYIDERNELLSEQLIEYASEQLKLTPEQVPNYNKFIVPTIPTELVELLKYINAFTQYNTIYTLSPMIYTFWS
jgi:hypothetical protein